MQNARRFVVKKGDEARQELLEGVFFGADAVRRTLGPYGRNAVSGIRGGTPHITNDGVSILKELWLEDEIKMLGLRTARESALQLNDKCGDGTTSAMVFTYSTLLEFTKRIGYTIVNPADGKYVRGTMIGAPSVMEIKRQIEKESAVVIDELRKMATPVKSREELIGAVRVSVEDEKLAELIGGMQYDLGPEGTILVEDSNEPNVEIERISGIRFDNGFPTSSVINNQERQTLELENVQVIFTNGNIGSLADFRSPHGNQDAGILTVLMNNAVKSGRPPKVVIVARKFDQLAMQEIAAQLNMSMKNGNALEIYPINAPYVNQTQMFKDMAAILGGTFINVEEGRDLRDMTLSDVGFATKVQASRWNAIFAGNNDEKARSRIEERSKILQKELKGETSDFAKKMLEGRIAQLKNGFALMKVGAKSQAEQKRVRDKIDDAVASARSALQEGLVPGAGKALMDVADKLPEDAILKTPLRSIYEQIQMNAGVEFEIEAWVKDPVKVVCMVVEKATEIAGDLGTAEIAIEHENLKPRKLGDAAIPGHTMNMGADDTAEE